MKNKQTFKVESGIPLQKRAKPSIYPFDKMKVNDSFLIPVNGLKEASKRAGLYASLKNYNKSQKKTISIATRKAEGGLRVWRTK